MRTTGAVTRILSAIEGGDPHATEQLLPLVYDELHPTPCWPSMSRAFFPCSVTNPARAPIKIV
jgi:ECF sigma factor